MTEERDRIRFDIYKALFEGESARRGQLEASLSVPAAAMSFTMFGFGGIAWQLDLRNASGDLVGLHLWAALVALLGGLFFLGAIFGMVRALEVFRHRVGRGLDSGDSQPLIEPPTLDDLDTDMKGAFAGAVPSEADEQIYLYRRFAGIYDLCYDHLLVLNSRLRRWRDFAIRYTMLTIGCLLISYGLVVIEKAG